MADSDTHHGSGGGGGPAIHHTASTSAAAFPAPSTARRLLRLLGGSLPANSETAASQLSQPATMMAGNGSGGGCGQSQPLTEQEGADLLAYLQQYGRALHAEYGNGRRRREERQGELENGGGNTADGAIGDGNIRGGDANRDDVLFSALVVATLRAAHRSTADHFSSSSAVGIASGAGAVGAGSSGGDRPTSSGFSNGINGVGMNTGGAGAGGASAGGGMMEIDTPLAVANLMASGGPPPSRRDWPAASSPMDYCHSPASVVGVVVVGMRRWISKRMITTMT